MDASCRHSAKSDKRVAVLILHGVGQQAKFETLSSFAAGLSQAAGSAQVRRTPLFVDGDLESALTIRYRNCDVDIIEYYYQPLMQRKVGISDVARWLIETGFHIRRIYRDYDFRSPDPKGARANKAKGSSRSPANGDFLRLHYMLYQRGNVIAVWFLWGLAWLLDKLERLRNVPLSSLVRWPLRTLFSRFVDPVLKEVAGDLIAYTAYDPKLGLHSVRSEILCGCVNRIESLVRCQQEGRIRYQEVFVAGHSLGSVIAYDALSRVAQRADHAMDTDASIQNVLKPDEMSRIGGLVTFGSPLDKIALMFWPRLEDQSGIRVGASNWDRLKVEYRQGLLAHFHGIRGLSESLGLPSLVAQPPDESLRDLPWLNVHHPDDLIAGHLDAFAGVTNVQISQEITSTFAARRTAEAHGCYWHDRAIYDWLLTKIDTVVDNAKAQLRNA